MAMGFVVLEIVWHRTIAHPRIPPASIASTPARPPCSG